MILSNLHENNKFINLIHQQEQLNVTNIENIYKIKINFSLKNNDKNKFIFIVNMLLLERASGQRVAFLKEYTDFAKIKPLKIGCTVLLRKDALFNFLKMLVLYSLPKLYELTKIRNQNLLKQSVLFINFDKFLFLSIFSFFIDFDKFLTYYEDLIYHFNLELFTGSHRYISNRVTYSLYGIQTF